MLFQRVKPLDKILETAEKKSLKRQLGAFQLTMLGIGAIIGTGIFVLTAGSRPEGRPGDDAGLRDRGGGVRVGRPRLFGTGLDGAGLRLRLHLHLWGDGRSLEAWTVGWALVLEYAVAAGAVSVGWSGYMNGLLASAGMELPTYLKTGPMDGGAFNLLAFCIALLVTGLLVIGTSKSAKVNAILVLIKVAALTAFIAIAMPAAKDSNFEPFFPTGWGNPLGGIGVLGAAASIFFAYVGYDAVSTAARKPRTPIATSRSA